MSKTTNWVGQNLELTIEKVAHGGIFVARHDGRVVFVSHVLPGEKVKARVYEDRGGSFCRAEPTEILEASPDRVKQVWKEAGVGGAGGAEFGHIKLSRQRELKADVLEEALDRMAGVKLRPVVEAAPGDDEANGLSYRTRVQMHVDEAGNVGPYRERSHEVVRVKDLPLAVEDIREIEMHRRNFQDVKKVEVATSSTGQVQWKIDSKLKGDERLIERAFGRTFRITGGGFWQVHKKAAEVLSTSVVEMTEAAGFDPAADNLDLYGGVGLFSGALVAKYGTGIKITTVESFKQATEDAILNLSDVPKAKAICAPVERFMNKYVSEHHAALKVAESKGVAVPSSATIIIDPPRSGAGAKVIGQIIELAPKNLIYVACDPIALARDLKPLLAGGYALKNLRAFDLFPHTHHVEAIASLVRI